MTGDFQAPERRPSSGRVWFVLLCAGIVIVFLAVVLPGVFDLRHSSRRGKFTAPIERVVVDAKGTTNLDISASRDGHAHITQTASVSKAARLVESWRVKGKTLYIRSHCTGSRLGILRRCDVNYVLRLPAKAALVLRIGIGKINLDGVRGSVDLKIEAGDVRGEALCSRRMKAEVEYFGRIVLKETCFPDLIWSRMKAGDIELTVPAGHYDVHAATHSGGIKRPFENIIEDPSSPHKLDLELSWGGSIKIAGTGK